ncbi:AI-2E family transporter [Actinomadura scrupuli]|uniref:AI-2E family transporter n=1 Tax=Actinomadura scrupuli TaxID=559629 RepID=UPI003D956E22
MAGPQDPDRRMPPWLPRAFLLAGGVVMLFLFALRLLQQLRGLLLLLVVSLFLAFAIEPIVNRLAARGWRRGAATGLVMIVLIVVMAAFATMLGSLLADQISNLVQGFPGYVTRLVGWLNSTFHARLSQADIAKRLDALRNVFAAHLADLAGNVWGIGTTALGIAFQTLSVLLFGFYFSADGPRFRRAVCSLLPPRQQHEILRAWEITAEKTGAYLYSRALLALVSTFAHYIAFSVLDVPFALTLALWTGVASQFIPTIGTYLAGAIPVLVALAVSPLTALWVLVFIIAYQQLENYLLHPRITAKTLDIHPAVAFGMVVAGSAVLGPVGALLSLPAGASIQAFAGAYVRRYEVEEHPLTTPAGKGGPTGRTTWTLRRPRR